MSIWQEESIWDEKARRQSLYADCKQLFSIRAGTDHKDSTIYSDEWKAYDGLVNAGYKRHYRVTHSEDVFANGRAHVNGIENFWGVAKSRMNKMIGIRKDKFNLHLKETEWRFNHPHENIYKLLLSNLRLYPL